MKNHLLVLALGLTSCAQFSHHRDKPQMSNVELEGQKKATEDSELINAEKVLALGRFEEALVLFRDFQIRWPASVYFQSSRLGEAQCLEGLGRPQDAVAIYRDVSLKTKKYQPAISALSLYRMSIAFESLGEDERVVAALLDAQKQGAHLPIEIREAQIPARIAAVYARAQRDREAMTYLLEADKGITRVIAEKGKATSKEWLAKMYFEMGSVSTNQLSVENFEDFVSGLRAVQAYLLKALKLNEEIWSARSLEHLRSTYQSLYILFESSGQNKTRQILLGGALVNLIDQADLFRPAQGQQATPFEKDFFSYASNVRKKTDFILYGSEGFLKLTDESRRIRNLRGSSKSKEEEPALIPVPTKEVPEEDPNL